jgi:hypothetical protein
LFPSVGSVLLQFRFFFLRQNDGKMSSKVGYTETVKLALEFWNGPQLQLLFRPFQFLASMYMIVNAAALLHMKHCQYIKHLVSFRYLVYVPM